MTASIYLNLLGHAGVLTRVYSDKIIEETTIRSSFSYMTAFQKSRLFLVSIVMEASSPSTSNINSQRTIVPASD